MVGAKALVTADVDPLSIYGGVPAKKLRGNATWDRSAVLRPETIDYVRELGRGQR